MSMFSASVHRIGLVCLAATLLRCGPNTQEAGTASSQHANEAVADIQVTDPQPYPFKFVAFGDMRFAEKPTLFRKPIADATARQQVIDRIGTEAPAFVVATGDFVFRGFHAEDWTYFDKAIKSLRDRGTPISPAIGNHEVGPFPPLWGPEAFKEIENLGEKPVAERGLKNYYKEFPGISQKRWYSVRYANCYLIVLDSELADEQSNAAQDQWVKTQLDSIPAGVDYISTPNESRHSHLRAHRYWCWELR